MIKKSFPRKIDLILHFDKFSINKKKKDIENQYFKLLDKKEKLQNDEIKIIDNFKKENKKVKNAKTKTNPNITSSSSDFILNFLGSYMSILPKTEDFSHFDNFAFSQGVNISTKFINKNKKIVENIYYQLHEGVEKFYPGLTSLNIPKVLSQHPKLKRRTLLEIFIQYKILLKICIALNKSMEFLKRGIDFETFFRGIPQMNQQGVGLAEKIFETVNKRNNNTLGFDEFVKGMMTFKSKEISDKIDMFFKIIDSDGNGLLSYDEVKDLSRLSLQRGMGDHKDSEVIEELAEYFANLIFQVVDIPIHTEIPLKEIRNKIILRGKEASYLEMFVGTAGDDEENVLKYI